MTTLEALKSIILCNDISTSVDVNTLKNVEEVNIKEWMRISRKYNIEVNRVVNLILIMLRRHQDVHDLELRRFLEFVYSTFPNRRIEEGMGGWLYNFFHNLVCTYKMDGVATGGVFEYRKECGKKINYQGEELELMYIAASCEIMLVQGDKVRYRDILGIEKDLLSGETDIIYNTKIYKNNIRRVDREDGKYKIVFMDTKGLCLV